MLDLDILFGIPFEEDMFRVINFCIMYGKQYIFDCQLRKDIVSIDSFKPKLKIRLEVGIDITGSRDIRLDTKKILLVKLLVKLLPRLYLHPPSPPTVR